MTDATFAELLADHNRRRDDRAGRPLARDPALERAADRHAADMARHQSLSHTSADGRGLQSRLAHAGAVYTAAGENIARGQPTPAAVTADWFLSPGHRANLLNPDYQRVGFGHAVDAGGRPYWCAVFAGGVLASAAGELAEAGPLDADGPVYTLPPDLVIGAEADFLAAAGETNWGMSWEGLGLLRELAGDGAGVTTCVVDTGGTPDQHPLLSNIAASRDFTGSPRGAAAVHPHGTHCLGTVGATDPRIGVAPKCRLVSGKGLSDSGSGPSNAITGGMRFGAENGAEVISMSLGSPGEDPGITGLMRELAARGVWVVCAAGNSGGSTPDVDWPARSRDCVSVAALDQTLAPASFTNAGAKIDTAGPGVNIWSTVPGGRFQQMSGTSMATPYVAGVLTLYRAALKRAGMPIPGIADLRAQLLVDSTDVFSPGVDRRTGPGALKAVMLALNLTPEPKPVG